MKITIEVDIAPQEIPAATELLRTLRLLADSVRLKAPAELYPGLIRRLADPSQLQAVADDVISLLGPAALPTREEDSQELKEERKNALVEFEDAFLEVLFDPTLHPMVGEKKTVLPFLRLLPRLPEHAQGALADKCKKEVIRRINQKRPISSTSRGSFYHFADAFACLMLLNYIPVHGMLSVAIKILQKGEDFQAAMVTALARAVELCYQQIMEQADPQKLQDLLQLLNKVHPDYRYEADYIRDTLALSSDMATEQSGTSTAMEGQSSQTTHSVQQVLQPRTSFVASSRITSLVWDERRSRVVAASADGLLQEWTMQEMGENPLNLSPLHVHGMDIMPQDSTIVATVAHRDAVPGAAIVKLSATEASTWREDGRVNRFLVTSIRALSPSLRTGFFTGENDSKKIGLVCLYDPAASGSFSSLQPLRTYADNNAAVSCLAALRSNPSTFLSGCADNTVRIFDSRKPDSVGSFGTPSAPDASGVPPQFVTALDAAPEFSLITGTYEGGGTHGAVTLWDLRSCNAPVFTVTTPRPVVHVAVGGSLASVALSTMDPGGELYSIDLSQTKSNGPIPVPAMSFSDGRDKGLYNALKWDEDSNTLFAGGMAGRVDSFVFA